MNRSQKSKTEMSDATPDPTKSNPRAASVRLEHYGMKTAAGQRRHDLRIGPQPAHVDSARSHLNRVLIENERGPVLRDLCAERRQAAGAKTKMRKTAAVMTGGIITFGAEAAALFERLDAEAQDAAFRELVDRIAARLATSVHGLVVHLDEATLHAHFQFASFNEYGVPLSKVCTPTVLKELQDITAEVMAAHCPGIERGTSKLDRLAAGADYADTLHKSVRELHRDLPRDLEAKRAEVARETAAAEKAKEKRAKNEKLAAAAREKLKLARSDEKATRKLVKNVALYEGRVGAAEKELADAEAKAAALAAQIASLEDAEARARAETAMAKMTADKARQNAEALVRQVEADRVAAAAEARAKAAAYESLAREIEQGTLGQDESGKLYVADVDALRPAMPHIGPVIRAAANVAELQKRELEAAAKARAAAERDQEATARACAAAEESLAQIRAAEAAAQADRVAAAEDREAAAADRAAGAEDRRLAAKDRKEAASVIKNLRSVWDRIVFYIKGDKLPPAVRAELRELAKEAGRNDLPKPTIAELAASPAKQPGQEPRTPRRDRNGDLGL